MSAIGVTLDSFLDGFSGAGLFGRLRRPGAPDVFFGEPGAFTGSQAADTYRHTYYEARCRVDEARQRRQRRQPKADKEPHDDHRTPHQSR